MDARHPDFSPALVDDELAQRVKRVRELTNELTVLTHDIDAYTLELRASQVGSASVSPKDEETSSVLFHELTQKAAALCEEVRHLAIPELDPPEPDPPERRDGF